VVVVPVNVVTLVLLVFSCSLACSCRLAMRRFCAGVVGLLPVGVGVVARVPGDVCRRVVVLTDSCACGALMGIR
jgi:hypothetical protein